MSESVKSREATNPQQLLISVMELRVSLSSLLDEERRRLRRITIDEPSTGAEISWNSAGVTSVEAQSEPPTLSRVEPVIEREPHFRAAAASAQESRPRFTLVSEGSVPSASRTHDNHEPSRPENPRKRLDELAKLLDKRAKQSAESVLKGSETKESER